MNLTTLRLFIFGLFGLVLPLLSDESEGPVTPPESATTTTEPLISEQEKEVEAEAQGEKDEQEEPEVVEIRQIFGWKEWVKIGSKADEMRAKLDSGARTSSLHAEDVEEFERDGREWVRFTLCDPTKEESKRIEVKAPVQRISRVKNTDKTVSSRYVVELSFELGGMQRRAEFNLNDRTGFTCPILLGRNILSKIGWVDSRRVDLAEKKIFR